MAAPRLEKTYHPQSVELRWSRFWVERGLFRADPRNPAPPFCIVIPPPNITGSLHIGHALNATLQDILVRWKRMQGYNTLWLPGTDHAGIATQNVVERQLLAEGTTREKLGRETFIQRIWAWKEQSGNTIVEQLKQLGASCDWSRLRFTMDEGLSRAVRKVFVQLYEEGLLYRGERLINWCPRCLTALSDIEVEHETITDHLYFIRYPVPSDPALDLVVATTRPETLLGDTAVAVHPDDPRYSHAIGRQVALPLTTRTIPILADPILVDREFGTGVVKVTPAHDFNDFEAGLRHHLPRIALFDAHARLAPHALETAHVEPDLVPALSHRTAQEARTTIVETLKERGLLVKVEPHTLARGHCYRCKTVIEPFLSPQWFVRIQPLADPAIEVVESGHIRIIPSGWVNNYLGWMKHIKDWCISRQLWWGHQIPAWYCRSCLGQSLSPQAELQSCLIPQHATPIVAEQPPTQCPRCGSSDMFQDPDVLDTWFSSALWPFSTLGWPDRTADFETYYPTSVLVTGLDILFFWVSRMIMMGLKFTGTVPFYDVYIHALVRDAEGQKMSKSKGNVIDPLTKMRQYGTDALRFTLAAMASPGRDIKLAEERIEGYRNFITKLWNAARFIALHANGERSALSPALRPFHDRWILSRLNHAIRACTEELTCYRFDRAASILYQFLWHEYCDWYIELAKAALQDASSPDAPSTRHTLLETLELIQRLFHPFIPFVTEEIWQSFPHTGESIATQPYPIPRPEWDAPEIERDFSVLEQFIDATRTLRALLQYTPTQPVAFYGGSSDEREQQTLVQLAPRLIALARGPCHLKPPEQWPTERMLRLVVGSLSVGTPIEQNFDLAAVIKRIEKQVNDTHKECARLEARLASPAFKSKADPAVVTQSEHRLAALRQEASLLDSCLAQLRAMAQSV
ncbi:MAG: valine--tRNA ligase [Nitrospirae bacterium]|nr:MAG: valine--tRNA ligase [Nitrospirota bacterium]